MPKAPAIPKVEQRLRLRHEILTEAKLRLVYAEQAQAVAKNGLNDMYQRYSLLAQEANERMEALKAEADKLG